jgi:hypothetical protein
VRPCLSPHGLVGADGTVWVAVARKNPSWIVFTTLFVRGSMRETVPAT